MNGDEKPLETPAILPEAPVGSQPVEPTKPSPLDALFISPEEAQRIEVDRSTESSSPEPEPQQTEPEEQEETLLPEQVEQICKAIDRLGRKGLNLRAVVALLHDATPSIPKKHIKAVLEGLRELPAIYGRQKGA